MLPSHGRLLRFLLLALVSLTILPLAALPAHGQLVGVVCISKTTGPYRDSCSPNPVSFSGSVGETLTVAVNIRASEGFHGFQVSVRTDARFLDPVGFNVTGTILEALGSPTVIFSCVNGVGTACIVNVDGPGVVSLTVQAPAGTSTVTPTTGRLFTITYNIIAIPSNSVFDLRPFDVPIFFPSLCLGPNGTSVPNTCIDIFNPALIPVPETDQTATFR
jgi:hypothetical protein